MWTYYEIEIFIHHACSPEPFDRAWAPAYEETANRLIRDGLLKHDDEGILRATERGAAWGEMLKSTPLPVHRFVDPRLDSLEK